MIDEDEPAGPGTEAETENVVDALFGDAGSSEPAVAAPVVAPVVEPAQSVVETPAPEAVTGEQPESEQKEPKFVPLGAVLDEREKRKEAQERAKQLEAELEKYKAPQDQPQTALPLGIPTVIPDYLDDPEGHQTAVAQITTALQNQQAETERQGKARLSNGFVESMKTIGQEATEAVFQLMQSDPQVNQFVANHYNPAEAMKAVHAEIQRRKFFEQIPQGVDHNEWILQKAAEIQAQQQATPQPPATTPQTPTVPVAPPRSLAAVAGGPSALKEKIPDNGVEFAFGD